MQLKLTADNMSTLTKIKDISGLSFNAVMKQALENLLKHYQQGVNNDCCTATKE